MIRLTAIELENFKNVTKGHIALSSVGPNPEEWNADIVGIYGQNGSGKTSVIMALFILKAIWKTGKLSDVCEDCIAAYQDALGISVEAVAHSDRGDYPDCSFSYTVKIGRVEKGMAILYEKLTYRVFSNEKVSTKTAFGYRIDGGHASLKPKTAWDSLSAMGKDLSIDMAVAQRMAAVGGYSLLMSDMFGTLLLRINEECLKRIEGNSASKANIKAYNDVWIFAANLREELRDFAVSSLSIVTPSRQAEPMLNIMRIATHEGSAGVYADTYFGLNLSQPALITEEDMCGLKATISTISTVVSALVPGLYLDVKSLGSMVDDNGDLVERVEIMAIRGDIAVPLRAESEGIKKLVSILVLFVDVYAKPNACVAIDELDSGVFEFLLGEILQVLQDSGRGQLVFTAHNLRPLETLDKTSLVFTTTNPQNRYVTFKGTKAASNLRSQYLRAINLGGQPETVYEATSKYEIDSAFFDAANPES